MAGLFIYAQCNRHNQRHLFFGFTILLYTMKQMKFLIFAVSICTILTACRSQTSGARQPQIEVVENSNYFPVTEYIKGQIHDIKERKVNPLLYSTDSVGIDSIWVMEAGIDTLFSDFLTPKIDTVNMKPFFKETKFLDQSIGAFTLTYEPIGKLPDSTKWQSWDVYVNPESGNVKRLFLKKNIGNGVVKQLTWLGEEGVCKIVTINTSNDNTSASDTRTIKWKF